MEEAATKQHAYPNTVFHCLDGCYYLGYTKQELAHVYNKAETTIRNWVRIYEDTGTYQCAQSKADRKFTAVQRQWLFDYFQERPLAYLDEAQAEFKGTYHISISKTTAWRIIHDFGLTWKVIESRAMYIEEQDVFRFAAELAKIDWSHQNLVFLDEVSFDNRGGGTRFEGQH
ncbi:hypothetical protein JG688_00008610 [Phytophthora aleatoria]|uniref:Winged helix-turn helix domain-containing protein n=1 Tax=Phytophthora aleatoria TaxID=2496075 RepID=A0A8J5INC8_9STRA|nr:hypothetical protein JG688_00008610 [Phytophthora aleatoria]